MPQTLMVRYRLTADGLMGSKPARKVSAGQGKMILNVYLFSFQSAKKRQRRKWRGRGSLKILCKFYIVNYQTIHLSTLMSFACKTF